MENKIEQLAKLQAMVNLVILYADDNKSLKKCRKILKRDIKNYRRTSAVQYPKFYERLLDVTNKFMKLRKSQSFEELLCKLHGLSEEIKAEYSVVSASNGERKILADEKQLYMAIDKCFESGVEKFRQKVANFFSKKKNSQVA